MHHIKKKIKNPTNTITTNIGHITTLDRVIVVGGDGCDIFCELGLQVQGVVVKRATLWKVSIVNDHDKLAVAFL